MGVIVEDVGRVEELDMDAAGKLHVIKYLLLSTAEWSRELGLLNVIIGIGIKNLYWVRFLSGRVSA